jgi:hypothetical protein
LLEKRAVIPVDIAVVQIANMQKKQRIVPKYCAEHLMLGAGLRA